MRRLAFVFVFLCFLAGCATNPVTGKSELQLVSRDREISIGEQQYLPAVQSQGGYFITDPDLTRYVSEVGTRVAAASGSTDLPYEFVVVNDSTPNAWALPGGKIGINRGLLMQLENEAELAAVLGHEVVHAAARHGAKAMERAMLLQGAVLLTAVGTRDSDYSNYIVGSAAIGAQLITQRYGRQAELEADLYGMRYMAAAGFDPSAAISLQEKFVQLNAERNTSWLNGLFASHPPSEQRVAQNRETYNALSATVTSDWENGTARYDRAMAYLRSKADAYAAYDQASALAADKEHGVALRRIDKAIELEPKEARFYGLKANVHLSEENYADAVAEYTRAVARDEQYFEYYLGRGVSHSRLGNRSAARADLEKSNQLLPTALATNELGQIALASGDRATAKRYFAEVANTSGPLSESARASFIKLDATDNPARYFNVSSERRNGRFYSVVTNNTGMPVKSTTVSFYAVINGRAYQATARGAAMPTGGRVGLYPGWRISETDVIENVNVKVTSVTF